MTEMKEFARNTKAKRENKRMTQRELAAKVGITPATISAYEKQVKFPSLENALLVAKALGTTVDEMCGNCAAITLLDKIATDQIPLADFLSESLELYRLQESGVISRNIYDDLIKAKWEGLN